MKAIVFTQYGSPDGLELKEVPKPAPKDGELLIRVHASSINSWDWEYLNGKPFINRLMFGLLKPKRGKQRLGADIAGTVEAIGRQVTRFQPGDEVFGDLWSNWGGFADYACAHETALQPKPENSTFEEAAAVPQAGVLALQGIRKAGQLRAGTEGVDQWRRWRCRHICDSACQAVRGRGNRRRRLAQAGRRSLGRRRPCDRLRTRGFHDNRRAVRPDYRLSEFSVHVRQQARVETPGDLRHGRRFYSEGLPTLVPESLGHAHP